MITEIYNKDARHYYFKALVSIIGGDEAKTGQMLNSARDALLQGSHCTTFCDEDVKRILPHLTVETFNRLYGDYGCTSDTRWIRDSELIDMIMDDLRHLSPLFREENPRQAKAQIDADGPAVRLVG